MCLGQLIADVTDSRLRLGLAWSGYTGQSGIDIPMLGLRSMRALAIMPAKL